MDDYDHWAEDNRDASEDPVSRRFFESLCREVHQDFRHDISEYMTLNVSVRQAEDDTWGAMSHEESYGWDRGQRAAEPSPVSSTKWQEGDSSIR